MFKMVYSNIENFFLILKVVEQCNSGCINGAQESNVRNIFQTVEVQQPIQKIHPKSRHGLGSEKYLEFVSEKGELSHDPKGS